jgi:serine/threonine protein kinase
MDQAGFSSSGESLQKCGRYEVLGELARGGMGIVYLARLSVEGGFSRVYCLKVMHPHLEQQEDFVEMMLSEAKLAARIHHPNVVSTVDFGLHEGRYYMVLDYVEGVSLGTAMRLAQQDATRLFIPCVQDALRGLHAAHTTTDYHGKPRPIIHQDVSPDNILLGVDGSARISDFGIALEARQSSPLQSPRGKASFMAPEQLMGKRIDVRADLWSMGVVLWNLLTGQKLFVAKSAGETFRHVLYADIPEPSSIAGPSVAAFDRVVLRALSREREDRYQNAEEMARELEKAAAAYGPLALRSEIGAFIQSTSRSELERRRDMLRRSEVPSIPVSGAREAVRGEISAVHEQSGACDDPPTVPARASTPEHAADLEARKRIGKRPAANTGRPWRRRLLAAGLVACSIGGAVWFALEIPAPSRESSPTVTPSPSAPQVQSALTHSDRAPSQDEHARNPLPPIESTRLEPIALPPALPEIHADPAMLVAPGVAAAGAELGSSSSRKRKHRSSRGAFVSSSVPVLAKPASESTEPPATTPAHDVMRSDPSPYRDPLRAPGTDAAGERNPYLQR